MNLQDPEKSVEEKRHTPLTLSERDESLKVTEMIK
jgi:hypothetical protein